MDTTLPLRPSTIIPFQMHVSLPNITSSALPLRTLDTRSMRTQGLLVLSQRRTTIRLLVYENKLLDTIHSPFLCCLWRNKKRSVYSSVQSHKIPAHKSFQKRGGGRLGSW